jgi:hypothetical protein
MRNPMRPLPLPASAAPRPTNKLTRKAKRHYRLNHFEGLETRALYSVSAVLDGGTLSINGNGANDTITVDNVNGFTVVNGQSFDNTRITSSIDIEGGAGNDTVNILATNKLVQIFDTAGNDTFTVGKAGLMAGITGDVSIQDKVGSNTLTLDDSADMLFHSIKIEKVGDTSAGTVSGLSAGLISVVETPLTNFTVRGGVAGNVFTVSNTLPRAALTTLNTGGGNDTVGIERSDGAIVINGENGSDVVTLGLKKTASLIARDVTINNTSGSTNLTVDDSADATKRDVTLDFLPNPTNPNSAFRVGTITGFSSAVVRFNESEVRFVTVNAGGGGNRITVGDTARNNLNVLTAINTGKGEDTVDVRRSRGNLNIEGQGGFDTVSLGRAGNVRGVVGIVSIGNNGDGGLTDVAIDDSADTLKTNVRLTRSGNNGILSGFTTGGIILKGKQVGSVVAQGGSFGNTFDVIDVPENLRLSIFGGAGDDTFNVQRTSGLTDIGGGRGNATVTLGANGNMEGVVGDMTVTTGTGTMKLALNDQADSAAREVTINALTADPNLGAINGLSPAQIIFDRDHTTDLAINGGSGGNTFDIQDTLRGGIAKTIVRSGTGVDKVTVRRTDAPLAINGDDGRDTVTIAGAGNTLAEIHADVEVMNTKSFSAITFDDSRDANARGVKLSVGAATGIVTGLAPAKLSYGMTSVSSLTVLGGRGGNTFTVANTVLNSPVSASTTIKTGTGDDVVNIFRTGGPLNIDGQDGGDNVNLGLKNNAQAIKGQVTVDNVKGVTNLTINDQSDVDARIVNMSVKLAGANSTSNTTQASITGLTPAAIRYSPFAVGFLKINAGDGDGIAGNTFNIDGTHPGRAGEAALTRIESGGGSDKLNVLGTNTQLTLVLGDGDDAVKVGSAANTLDALKGAVIVAGDGDNDALSVNDQGSKSGRLLTQGANTVDVSDTVNIVFVDVESLKVNRGTAGNGNGTSGPRSPQIADVKFTSAIHADQAAKLGARLVDPNKGDKIALFIDWGDGRFDKSQPNFKPFAAKHKYAKAGKYLVRVTWTDSTGRSNFQELPLTVKAATKK